MYVEGNVQMCFSYVRALEWCKYTHVEATRNQQICDKSVECI